MLCGTMSLAHCDISIPHNSNFVKLPPFSCLNNTIHSLVVHHFVIMIPPFQYNEAKNVKEEINITIILDTETTGLIPRQDEVLQLAIITDQEEILFCDYIKPMRKTEWKNAEAINGISPKMVKDKKTFVELKDQIQDILNGADVIIGYNLGYDLSFLQHAGIVIPRDAEKIDVMEEFAPIFGEWNDYYETYKWQKLETAAQFYGYMGSATHDALDDTKLTLFVYKKMNELNEKLKKFL